MLCPTCGKPVRKNQEICSFCGSLARDIRFTETSPAFGDIKPAAEPVFATWDMHPSAPVFEDIKPDAAPQAQEWAPPIQAAEPSEAPPRRPVPLIRVLTLLIFLLIPVFNSVLRNFIFERQSSAPPVLREALYCENISQELPANPRASFSLNQDGQILLYSHWKGSRRNHSVVFRWYTPQGALLASPVPATQYLSGSGEFAVISILPLRAGMAPGIWRTDVLLDGQPRASLRVQVAK
jgi:hypothetical protein